MKKLELKIKLLRFTIVLLAVLYIPIVLISFKVSSTPKFEEIDVERINIVEEDGTLKLAIFNSKKLKKGEDDRQGQGTVSGMLFYNQEGYESGGLLFDGKKIGGGQESGIGLMFDGYRQDQTIALQHNEKRDSLSSYYEDGLRIISRPDRAHVKEEYDFYALKYPDVFGDENTPKLSKKAIDSINYILSRQNKVAQKRIFLGSKRGDKGDGWYDESGLYIRNKYGKSMIKIYIDNNNQPKFEVLDTLGDKVKYNLIPTIKD